MKKQFGTTFILLCLVSGILLSGCGNEGIGTNETAGQAGESINPEENDSLFDKNGFEKDTLPDGLDFGGKSVSVYVHGANYDTEFYSETNGDIVCDAMYNRNKTIEERLNVTLNYVKNTGTDYWGEREIFKNTVRESVMANDGSIDIVAGVSSNHMAPLANEGMFVNLLDTKYLNFDAPWWPSTLRSELTMGDSMYLASGDASLGMIKGMMCIYFNKQLIQNLHLESPYDLVTAGEWTIDKLNQMATKAVSDIDGDTEIGVNDRYGLIIQNVNHAPNFVTGVGLRFSKIENGVRKMQLGTPEVVDIIDKIGAIMAQDGFYYKDDKKDDYANTFSEGRALFATGEFGYAEQYRDIEFDYGIIPFPMLTSNSSPAYYTVPRATYTMFGITRTADTDMCSAVLETLGSENYRSVTPVYYEKALKVKYSRDDVSSKMFDMIRNGVTFDFAIIHTDMIGSLTVNVRAFISQGKTGWASQWASMESSVNAALKTVMEAYENIE